MQLVLSWPIRLAVVAILAFSLFVDGAGYIYRIANHLPLTGSVEGLPPNFGGWQLYFHRGLDLAGGTHIDYELTNFPAGQSRADVQQRTIQVINRRVNALNVSEPEIRGAGSNNDRITVDLAGVNAAQAQKTIGAVSKLVYTKWVPDAKVTAGPEPGFKPALTGLTGDDISAASATIDSTGTSWVVNITFTGSGATKFDNLTRDNVAACPGDSATSAAANCAQRHLAIWLDLTQKDIDNWEDPTFAGKVSSPYDSGCLAAQTPDTVCGKFLTDPVTREEIAGGQAQISGSFTQQSATDLATGINSGSLPVDLVALDVTQVSATLGAESVKLSLAAGLLGLAIVVLFMIIYYRVPGLLASLALLFYAGAVLAIFKAYPVTLTLAGITGFILSVGMAVDANVLIFERFKEEVRAGRTITAAVDAAVRRAWPAIRDSNTSTFITCVILAFVGPSAVKGFAFTLGIGVLASLVSSIVVTHNLLAIVLTAGGLRRPALLGVDRVRAV
ncbi:MAG: protein translocase subunit SecD [Chloroflexi bacterium]|nr:MAG: protein translocase subunit SecD [Chloroflexota bacterium]TMF78358.1 MAG: protein translocase subunit SecD [Chloroflexota bacterium]TMF78848.1 MAG: protein translocase subunit SecD [Chloroflexota bacterium]TMF92409.1 MAG: protein translocase subunit SecD [Chloroflexota bacterium]TMG44846.1 MAG: protein translocase subunit SecD [Chloroflexota bacterium]